MVQMSQKVTKLSPYFWGVGAVALPFSIEQIFRGGCLIHPPLYVRLCRSVWWGFVRGECMGHCRGDETLTLMRCHSLIKEICLWPSLQLKIIKGKISFFISFSFINLLLSFISWHDVCRPCGSRNWLKYN